MDILPFPFERLPSLRRRDLSVLRALRATLGNDRQEALARWARRLGLAAEEHCSLKAVSLAHRGTGRREAWPHSATVPLAVHGPEGRFACLVVDGPLASSLIALLLKSAPGPLCAPPTPGERGLITYAVATLLQELALSSWSVAVDEPHELPVGTLIEARLRLGRGAGGLAWLLLDESGLPAAESALPDDRMGRLSGLGLSLPLEAARLSLPLEELATLQAGDVLLFPSCPRPATDAMALLRVGAGGFPVRVADGVASVVDPFRMGGLMMSQSDEKRVIAEELELEVVVELGRARLSAAQLLELNPGDVLTLERPLDAPLELRVRDRLVARGELVDVEGETGVRLTQLYD